jgi:hypothetical protein
MQDSAPAGTYYHLLPDEGDIAAVEVTADGAGTAVPAAVLAR